MGPAASAPGAGSASSSSPADQNADPDKKRDGEGSNNETSEEANPEFTKEAANLVLKRLKDELARGEVDQELLDELGWTPEQMKKFADRMQQQLEDKGEDNSLKAQAQRRQFEEMLRNLDVTSKTQRRNDTNKDKQVGEGVGTVRRPPPPEYREWVESYTKSLSKKRFGRFELMGFVLLGWALMLAWSKPWLARFRFGPLEWLWRSLTYGRIAPFRRPLAIATDSQ